MPTRNKREPVPESMPGPPSPFTAAFKEEEDRPRTFESKDQEYKPTRTKEQDPAGRPTTSIVDPTVRPAATH